MWLYKCKELEDADIPTKAIGFIYLITQISTGKFYIGRKLLTSASSKTVNGKKKKTRKDSGWRDYWSSSPKIKEWIDESGTDDFKREILVFVNSKSELMYAEEYALYTTNALLDDSFLNENIRAKIMRSWFSKNNVEFLSKMKELHNILP
jgi:hypothetical protein